MTKHWDEPDISVDFADQELVSLTAEQKQVLHKADPMGSGFLWYTPPMASEKHQTGGHSWIISGHDMQVLSVSVPPGERVVTEVGSFFYGTGGIKTEVDFTCCSGGEGCERICGGESCVKVLLTNASGQEGIVGLTPGYPAKVIPLKFGTHIKEDHMLIAQPGSYMSHLGDVHVGMLDIAG